MSAIAALYNVPAAPDELSHWAFAHMAHHRDINRRVYELFAGTPGFSPLPEFILDPLNPNDTGVWEDQHQILHEAMDAVLGISGYDLSQVDFKDTDLLGGWIYLNANEHYQAANILGIG